jgi:adenylate cyclase
LERKLTAILCADVYGYSRLMSEDEEATLRTLSSHRKFIDSLIEQHRGRFVNSAGDSVLAEFVSVVNAVQCAVEIQNTLKAENVEVPPDRRMQFRIGVNLGDVMVEGDQIYGDGVNVAARLESLADPGGICVSGFVHDHIKGKLALNYQDLGAQQVKNIAEPVRVYRVLSEDGAAGPGKRPRVTRQYLRRGVSSLAGIAIVVGTIFLVQHVSLKPPHTSASIPPQQKPALPLPSIPSIAVLPFTNLSGDPGQEYFSDGLTDNVIINLSRLAGVFVIARNSSFSYKGKAVTVQQVGRELGVRTVLQGSVLRAGGRVRINVQLADAANNASLWAQSFDQPLSDIFTEQDEIVREVVVTLSLLFKLRNLQLPQESSQPTDNLEAFDDVLRGWEYLLRLTKDDLLKARELFEKAAELDPKYAAAYAGISVAYGDLVFLQLSPNPQADLKRGSEFAHKALALDDSDTNALRQVAQIEVWEGRPAQAVADAERAVAVNSNDAFSYDSLGKALVFDEKPKEAIPYIQKAIRLDPESQAFYGFDIGFADLFMGRYAEASQMFEKYLAVLPNDLNAHALLCMAYIELGREDDARKQVAEITRINPHYEILADPASEFWRRFGADLRKAGLQYLLQQGQADTLLGRYEEAIPVLKRDLAFSDYLWDHVLLVRDYVELGQEDAARAEAVEVQRLSALDPNSAAGYWALALALDDMGESAQALAAVHKAISLDPADADKYLWIEGYAYLKSGRYPDALAAYRRHLAVHPGWWYDHLFLAMDYIELGRDDAARAEAAEVMRLNPQFSVNMVYRTVGPKGQVLAFQQRASADLHKAGLQ